LKDGSLYTGQTSNLQVRIEQHNKGRVKATRTKAPYRLGYFESFDTRAKAMWREWEFKKKWNTERKKKLMDGFVVRNEEAVGLRLYRVEDS